MKIEKRKVTSAIAATLGLTAAFTLNACDDSTSASSDQGGDTVTPNPESSAQVEPGSSAVTEGPAISSQAENGPASSQAESALSSSSTIVDIPLSHEPISSEALEALSSFAESSSSVDAPTSSVNAAISVADNPTSSAAEPFDVKPTSSSTDLSEVCPDNDPWCIEVHMCEGQPGGCMVASMVTTFERTDIGA